MGNNTIENRKIKQLKRDLSRATFYLEQMIYAETKFRAYYYGIQSVVFGAIIKVRYEKDIEELRKCGMLDSL